MCIRDRSRATENSGNGTQCLSGSHGNKLIVQQTEDSIRWKVNQDVGVLVFGFAVAVDENGCKYVLRCLQGTVRRLPPLLSHRKVKGHTKNYKSDPAKQNKQRLF